MKRPFLLTLCLLSVLISCGSDKDSDDEEQEREDEVNQETEGFYEAKIVPLNSGIAGSTVGDFRIRVLGDEVRVRGEIANSPPVFHRQFVHTEGNCPGPGADTDLDGTLSFSESLRITGAALIPLDRNLSTQTAGFIFPVPGRLGNYTYFEITSLVRMLADLHAEDPDPSDFLTKLSPDENLKLSGRTIVIYGVRGNSQLPIACGTIIRGVEPLPDGPVVRPAPPVIRPPQVPWDDFFTSPHISGRKCHGGERTEDDWFCRRNQWLVTINGVAFISELVLVPEVSTNQRAYYNIRPVSPVDLETLETAREHWVRFERAAAPVVLRKPLR